MTSALHNRVRRLEQQRANAATVSIAELLRQARARNDALTPEQRAEQEFQSAARCAAALAFPEPEGDGKEARLLRSMRRMATWDLTKATA